MFYQFVSFFFPQMHHPIQMKPADSENRSGEYLEKFLRLWGTGNRTDGLFRDALIIRRSLLEARRRQQRVAFNSVRLSLRSHNVRTQHVSRVRHSTLGTQFPASVTSEIIRRTGANSVRFCGPGSVRHSIGAVVKARLKSSRVPIDILARIE